MTETEARQVIVSLIQSKPRGWKFVKEQEESTPYKAAHPAYVHNRFWNNGDKYTLRIYASGKVKILLYEFGAKEVFGDYPSEAVSHKFESTRDLIGEVKHMIENEEFAEFTRLITALDNADGVTAHERTERKKREKALATIEDNVSPTFWERLFGGK